MRHVKRLVLGFITFLCIIIIASGAMVILQHPKWILFGFVGIAVAAISYCLGTMYVK